MFKFKTYKRITGCFVIFIFTLVVGIAVCYAAPSTQNVNVVNTPGVNVSNTPNVNVTNTPTVNLAPGTNVGVTGPLGVTVGNTSSNPVPVSIKAPQSFMTKADLGCVISAGDYQCWTPSDKRYHVPTDYRAVIEYVACNAEMWSDVRTGSDQSIMYSLEIFTPPDTWKDIWLPLTPVSIAGALPVGAWYSYCQPASQVIRAYVDPGSDLSIRAYRWGGDTRNGVAVRNCTISGYLEPTP